MSKYHDRDTGQLQRPYNVLEKKLKPYNAKLLAEGFRGNLPLLQEITKSWWNECREIPDPVVVSNLGTSVDIWVPTNNSKDLMQSLILAGSFRSLRSAGMTEYCSISEVWYQKQAKDDDGRTMQERMKKYKRENEGVSLQYYSPSYMIWHLAEVQEGKNVRYLALPFDETTAKCKDGVPDGAVSFLHPRWMAFAPVDVMLDAFIAEYPIQEKDKEKFKHDMTAFIEDCSKAGRHHNHNRQRKT